jgi:heat shock protein HslJ
MARKIPFIACFGLALALAGCTTAAAGSGSPMAGTQWRLTAIDGLAPERPDGARVAFEQTRFTASAGCNTIGGDYRLEGGRMIAGSVVATTMACAGPIMSQEMAVTALLAGAPQIERQGQRLRLASAGHSLEAVSLGR